MKTMYLLGLIIATACSNFCFAEEVSLPAAEEKASVLPIRAIRQLTNEDINFAELSKEESRLGNLAEVAKGEESWTESLLESLGKHKILYPYTEGLVYLNGQLCYMAEYPKSISYTILEGPYYGLQTIVSYSGAVLYVNHEYELEYTPMGVIFHHEYADSEIITGTGQVILFY